MLARGLFVCFFASFLLAAAPLANPDKMKNPPLLPVPPDRAFAADPGLGEQWYLERIGATRVWRTKTEGLHATRIGVIDGGVEYNHPEIAENIWRNPDEPMNGEDDDDNGFVDDVIGWDFVKNAALPYDRGGHGMFMSTIIAGVRGNGVGGSGVCPKCSIVSLRFLNWEGLGDTEDAIKGLYYAAKAGLKVVNLSFAGEGKDKDLLRALEAAEAADVFVVVAAGNDGDNLNKSSIYPAKYSLSNMLTVAASGRDDALIKKSNYSDKYVHVAAPGQDIYGIWESKWDHGDGTSDATAVTTGAIGLIRSANPRLTAAQVKDIVMATVRHVPSLASKTIAGGVIDVEAAVRCAVDPRLTCLN